MPILSNNPVTDDDGNVYDRFAVYLAISPVFLDDDLGPSMALRLIRYRKDEDGKVVQFARETQNANGETIVETAGVSLNYTRLAGEKPELEQRVRCLMDVVQDIVAEKGL
jgi:hypothetical protein